MPLTSRQRKNIRTGLFFVSPWLIGFAVFLVYPIIASLYYSMTRYVGIGTPTWIGFWNYSFLVKDELFWTSLYNIMYYLVFAVPLGFAVGLSLALIMNFKVKEKSIYRTIIYFPAILPMFASAFIWLWMFNPQLGIINALLGYVGIDGPGWIGSPTWSKPSFILLVQWGAGGPAIILLAALQDVPRELYEAAELDGAGQWYKFRRITLPSISPVILFHVIMAVSGAFQFFDLPYIMTEGGPANSTLFYSLYLYRNAFQYSKMGYASAMAWILFMLNLGIAIIIFKTSLRWIYYRAG